MRFKAAFLSILLFATSTAHSKQRLEYVQGEVLVRFKKGTSSTAQTSAISRNGSRRLKKITSELSHLKLAQNQSVESAIAELKKDPSVAIAQPNYIYHVTSVPNDPLYDQLWGLNNTGQTIVTPGGPDTPDATSNPGTAGKDMSLEEAWTYVNDCSGVTVAILDTGINYNHVDLTANMWNGGVPFPNHGFDFVDTDNDPMDLHGHGTHVAGTIGAVGSNGTGTTGVCWTASLMAVRVMDASGSGTSANIALGINFAVTNGARVLNMSIGVSAFDAAIDAEITNAETNGVLVIAAAGNDASNNGASPVFPCNSTQSNVICVAALDQSYNLATFSNYGTETVDVGAPGVNIVSEWPGTNATTTDDFTAGWNITGDWAQKTISATSFLVNPAAFDAAAATYALSADERAYKAFNIAGANSAVLSFSAFIDTESTVDFFNTNYDATGADPFVAGTNVKNLSGSTGGAVSSFTANITPCISATCSVGFQLTSDAATVGFGIAAAGFSIKTLTLNAVTYNVIEGTSMATPHVAGLAALVWSFFPTYDYTQIRDMIVKGGVPAPALLGLTTSGRSVNAMTALNYLRPPSGVAAIEIK